MKERGEEDNADLFQVKGRPRFFSNESKIVKLQPDADNRLRKLTHADKIDGSKLQEIW